VWKSSQNELGYTPKKMVSMRKLNKWKAFWLGVVLSEVIFRVNFYNHFDVR